MTDTLESATSEHAPAGRPADRYCHLLDPEGRALCFADVSAGRVHGREGLHRCLNCGRLPCQRCNEIAMEIGSAA